MNNKSPTIPLENLPLRPSTLTIFRTRGFQYVSELQDSKKHGGMTTLAAELDVSVPQAADLFQEVQQTISSLSSKTSTSSSSSSSSSTTSKALFVSAADLLASRAGTKQIITFCRHVDDMLGGGIPLGQVTEVAGLPGVGKTQLAMQACVDASLPRSFGGVQGQSVYIDTEGSFSAERCYAMSHALVSHVTIQARRKGGNNSQINMNLQKMFQPDNILDGIHVYRAHDEAALVATIYGLPKLLSLQRRNNSPIKLIVIDSIAFHYRCLPPGSNYVARTRSLVSMASFLNELATKHDLAVLALNQMTTRFDTQQQQQQGAGSATDGNDSVPQSYKTVPALGESWAHAMTTRLLISRPNKNNSNARLCSIVKSPYRPNASAQFQILEAGIRDYDANNDNSNDNNNNSQRQEQTQGKRTPPPITPPDNEPTDGIKRRREQY